MDFELGIILLYRYGGLGSNTYAVSRYILQSN